MQLQTGAGNGEFYFETRVLDNDSIYLTIDKKLNFSAINSWLDLKKRGSLIFFGPGCRCTVLTEVLVFTNDQWSTRQIAKKHTSQNQLQKCIVRRCHLWQKSRRKNKNLFLTLKFTEVLVLTNNQWSTRQIVKKHTSQNKLQKWIVRTCHLWQKSRRKNKNLFLTLKCTLHPILLKLIKSHQRISPNTSHHKHCCSYWLSPTTLNTVGPRFKPRPQQAHCTFMFSISSLPSSFGRFLHLPHHPAQG